MKLIHWVVSFKPGFYSIPLAEKIRSGLALLAGVLFLGIALHLLSQGGQPLAMLASMSASAVLLYVVPHSPMSQPWQLVGGHLFSALAGWVCSLFISEPLMAATVAMTLSAFLMLFLNCLHPPGAATALIMVLNFEPFHHNGWQWVLNMVLANVFITLLCALIINNLIPGRCYPMNSDHHAQKNQAKSMVLKDNLTNEDIAWALTQMNGVIDVSEEDLLEIYGWASEHAKDK